METDEYILGTDTEELDRLRQQHEVWRSPQLELIERGGLKAGDRVLDLGCGPGFTSFELAERVGAEGRVVAFDQSERFLSFLGSEAERRGLTCIETRLGSIETVPLEDGSADVAYSRWLFSWLEDPGAVLARVARAVRPGGALLLQEYLDWGAMSLLPPDPAFDHVIAACMRSWAEGGGEINVAREIPRLAEAANLTLEHFEPRARAERADQPVWSWIGGFFESYLPRLVERGLLEAEACTEQLARWRSMVEEGTRYCAAPTMADIVLRKKDR